MNFSEIFIRRPVATILLGVGVFLAGAVAYHFLPVSSLPSIDIPTINVRASRPGADPVTMAATVAAPLERRLGEISGVTEITSSSSLGSTNITIQFDINRDIDGAAHDVQAAINAAATDLPGDLSSTPTFRKANPSATPIMILALTSDTMTTADVYDAADTVIAQRIAQVDGVSEVDVNGAQQPAVRIDLDPNRLAHLGIPLSSVETAITNASTLTPIGQIDGEKQSSSLTTGGQLTAPDEYGTVTLTAADGTVVHIRDLGHVYEGVVSDRTAGWIGRKPGVNMVVFKQTSANVVATADRVRALLPTLKGWIPAGLKIDVLTDRTITIRAAFEDLQKAMLTSLVLVMVVVLVFLRRVAATIAAGIAIPLSLAGTIAAMWACSFSLDNMSLMALTVSIGFVVDDAIVMIENAFREMENGKTPLQAALTGSRQIGFTVVSISLSLIAAFIPLLFMGGVIGRLFREFSITLVLAIAASAVVSLSVTPMICGRFVKYHKEPDHGIAHWIEGGLSLLNRGYIRTLSWTLKRPSLMIGTFITTLAATIALYSVAPKGFFPTEDTGILFGMMQASPDVSFATMSTLQQKAIDIILADPAVDGVGSFIGSGASNTGRSFIDLKPIEQRADGADVTTVIARLRPKLARVTGISTFLIPAGDIRVGGRQGNGSYQFTLWDSDIDELLKWVPKVVDKAKTLPGFEDVTTDRNQGGLQANVIIDRVAAARLGLSLSTIDSALNAAFSQEQISTIYAERNQYKVVMDVPNANRRDPSFLQQVYVPGTNNVSVPLSAVAHFEIGTTPLDVNHQGQFPSVTITYNLAAGASIGDASNALAQVIAELHPPSTLHAAAAGNALAFLQGLQTEPLLIAAALGAIYIVLGVLYENLIHPLTILSTLPSAGVGALIALRVMNTDLNLIAMLGIILLIGIVKKNGIMMVDFALDAERRLGMSPEAAILHASNERFRPILMTSLAALLGALPLAFASGSGSELRHPLGITIVGGMILSQLLTIYTTPTIYLSLESLSRKLGRKRAVTPTE